MPLRARGPQRRRRRRVARLLLSSADVNVVNRTTLALWHFQQLAQQLLPRASAANEPEEEEPDVSDDADASAAAATSAATAVASSVWPPRVALGEGMGVAAMAFEADAGTAASDSESSDDSDGDDAQQAIATMPATAPSDALADARFTPATQVGVVYRGYRCVVCLDASPSTLSIDPATGRLFLDMLYESVEVRGTCCSGSCGECVRYTQAN